LTLVLLIINEKQSRTEVWKSKLTKGEPDRRNKKQEKKTAMKMFTRQKW